MPEGDTIHRTANRLRPALVGHIVDRFEAARIRTDRPQPGDTIEKVEAVGKHLLIRFPRQLVLHTHMQMAGSWHLYGRGESWKQGAHLARVIIETADHTAVCFSAPTVRTWRDLDPTSSPLAHLGPDLCDHDVDLDLVVQRSHLVDETMTLADALLDQTIACGIGNVYKSEALWACRQHPDKPLTTLTDEARHELWRTASRQLRSNLDRSPRRTVAGGLAVYGRHRRSCLRCRTRIRGGRSGSQQRGTWWCPTCQPFSGDTGS